MNVFVIIPAAGLGTRMATKTAKQFAEINGIPILVHTLRRFVEAKTVTEIVVALRENEIKQFRPRLDKEELGKLVRLVGGGDNRQESVHNALRAIDGKPDDLVLVHDGVRPFVGVEVIESVINAAKKHGAAIAGIPAV